MEHNYTVDLTKNKKSKLSGSQTRDSNFQTIANNNSKKN